MWLSAVAGRLDLAIGSPAHHTDDHFAIRDVALYSARYGTLHRWSLQALLDTLAGELVAIAAERAAVWELLAADNTARHRIPAVQ